MKDWLPDLALDAAGPVYVSIDLDVLDPAFAPGVSHPEPGGPSTRDVVRFLQRLRGRVVAADVVELNPTRDPAGLTARVAAKLVKELTARLLEDEPG
jgi:arginase family enzyme